MLRASSFPFLLRKGWKRAAKPHVPLPKCNKAQGLRPGPFYSLSFTPRPFPQPLACGTLQSCATTWNRSAPSLICFPHPMNSLFLCAESCARLFLSLHALPLFTASTHNHMAGYCFIQSSYEHTHAACQCFGAWVNAKEMPGQLEGGATMAIASPQGRTGRNFTHDGKDSPMKFMQIRWISFPAPRCNSNNLRARRLDSRCASEGNECTMSNSGII